MTSKDFIYLNLPGLLKKRMLKDGESVEIPGYRERTLIWTGIVTQFLKENELVVSDASLWNAKDDELVLRFNELTKLGQEFIMSQAVERWLSSWDRETKKNPNVLPSLEKLQKRFDRFAAK